MPNKSPWIWYLKIIHILLRFSSFGFREFKSISRNAFQFPLPTIWANLLSILRYTEGFSFPLWLPCPALHTCTRADSPTRQPKGLPGGVLKEGTQKPAEHYRIYKNRKRRITILFFHIEILVLPCTCPVTRKHRVLDMFLPPKSCWATWPPDVSLNLKLNPRALKRLLCSDPCTSGMI